MLPEALSQADKKLRRERFLTILLAAVTILAGISVLVVVKYLGSAENKPVDTATAVDAYRPDPPADVSGYRDRFKQDLKYFESTIEPQLAAANLPAWSPQAASEIPALKNQALSSFAQEDYSNALESLLQARLLAEATLKEWEERYTRAYSQAFSFFTDGFADRAGLAIDQALTFKPSDPDALTLKSRIDVLPEVVSLLQEAVIARTENDLRKEIEALKQVVVLDPARTSLNERIRELEQKQGELEYASYINQGLKAVERRDLRKANSSLASAEALFPGRREARILRGRIASTARSISLSNAIQKGDAAIARDEWRHALDIFQQALRTHPNHAELLNRIRKAENIITLDAALSDYLSRHHRLSSPNVASAARKTLQESLEFSQMSRSLASKTGKLSELLAQYEIPVDLLIASDNKTHVSIRGLGNIGVIANKRISLRPGQYILEGKRSGFRSKLVRVVLNPGQTNTRVEVICDEQI